MTDQDGKSGDKAAFYFRAIELDLEGRLSWPVWVHHNPRAGNSYFECRRGVEDQENPSEKASHYLRAIELLEARMAVGGLDKRRLDDFRRSIVKIKQAFAGLFVGEITSMEFIYPYREVEVWPYWLVASQPKKELKPQAREWMAARGQSWDGSAQKLRDAVRRALHHNEPVPEGYFGLHVERTVKIRMKRAHNLHLLPGQP